MRLLRCGAGEALLCALVVPVRSAPPLSFDVASVKGAAPCCAAGQWRESKAGPDRIDFRYVTLKYCVAFAYGLKEYQVSGPAWINETRFDIVAKGPEGTKASQLPEMMQALLSERFKLAVHHEMKEFNVYVLAVDKGGSKLKESAAPPGGGEWEGAAVGMSMGNDGVGKMEVKHGNMTALTNTLVRLLGRPVVDRTGLTGRYDFVLDYVKEDGNGPMMPVVPANAQASAPEVGASVFTSVKKIGLKIEMQKPALDSVVVDKAEKSFIEN